MCIELWISDRIGLKSFISNSCIKGNKLEDNINKGYNKITELRTILQRESQNS
jgi:hypothetical protein